MLELSLAEIRSQGVNPLVVETYRPQERQNYLYCHHRTVAQCVAAGISKPFAEKYCDLNAIKETSTLHSIHTEHKAVDVVPQRLVNKKMKAIWNVKDPQTQIIINTMVKYGFEAGVNWSTFQDSPHFQVKGDFKDLFLFGHATPYVTMAIQIALNRKTGAGLTTDGAWGDKTTDAVNKFRQANKWSTNGKLGATALKTLLS
jgi:hypothetical protein